MKVHAYHRKVGLLIKFMHLVVLFQMERTEAFNILVDGHTENVFVRKDEVNSFGETNREFNGDSFFGYNIFLQLINNGFEDTIQFATGAPTEMLQSYKNSNTEEGGLIKEPSPQLRAAVSSTDAMGELYYCETSQLHFMNTTHFRIHNCTRNANIDRQLAGFELSNQDALGISLSSFPLKKTGQSLSTANTMVTCAHLREHDCGTNYKAEGACYVSETVPGRGDSQKITQWQKRVPCRHSCFEKDIDLMFVVDGSFSVGNESFNKVKNWIKDVSEGFEIAKQVQVGVVQYSFWYANKKDQTYMTTEIALGQYKDKKQFDDAVDSIKYHGYSTYTAHAINKTIKEDFNGPASRYPDARRVMILLTDGNADDAELLGGATKYAADQDVESFAVGVSQYRLDQLELIATSPGNVITVDDFDDLTNIVSELQKGIQIMEGAASPDIHNELMQCQAGISTAFDKNGALYLGAVGAYDWSGTVIKYDSSNDEEASIPSYEEVQRVLPDRAKESYLGYSVTSGRFNGGSVQYVASGAPRYMLEGAVVVYESVVASANFDNSQTLRAHESQRQLGSYFGGSVLALDVNNDNKDDLLVGAPLYTGEGFDEGRVFVFVTKSGTYPADWASPSEPPLELVSIAPGGRFGTTMASAGDLNKDGYNDVIIGAPLSEGDRGSIFIYHGSADGIDTGYKQKISASDITGTNLFYFGQSIQGGVDLDGNQYPDVAVGAPKSDTVVIFRSRPVAVLNGTVEFTTDSISILDCFKIENRQCVKVTACITVTGEGIEDNIEVNYTLNLDTRALNKRIEFRTIANSTQSGYGTLNYNMTIETGTPACETYDVYVKQTVEDYFSEPLVAELDYALSPRHLQEPLSSISDPSLGYKATDEAEFASSCAGPTCNYDLRLAGSITVPNATLNGVDLTDGGNVIIVGSDSGQVTVRMNFSNHAEVAFGARVTVTYPARLSWSNVAGFESSNPTFKQPCVADQEGPQNGTYLSRILNYQYDSQRGNIMTSDDWCYFVFKFSLSNLRDGDIVDQVDIRIAADTIRAGVDRNKNDNEIDFSKMVKYRADATVQRQPITPSIVFDFDDSTEPITSVRQIGVNTSDVQYPLEITGRGYANIPFSTITLSYPSILPLPEGSTGPFHLLYLYELTCESRTGGNAACECDVSNVNRYDLSINLVAQDNATGPSVNYTSYPKKFGPQTSFDCSTDNPPQGYVCEMINCNITNLSQNSKISFVANFRAWTKSFNLPNRTASVQLISGFRFSTENSRLLINNAGNNVTIDNKALSTTVTLRPVKQPTNPDNPIWIYILAAIGGLLLLIVIVVILWKLGFFKSKYANMKQEALEWNDANGGADGGAPNGDESTADMVGS
ncbi:unnamed protein product [Clavelina lepadiformis]|uniref:VWFA domain-containing protein n=1 Tax=Clavelina lepadiformis TaxID=159417 RepID=A0ABP0F2F7_CLALP